MNTINRPPLSVYREPSDHLDDLLRTYFQAEMPHPWPQFQAPQSPRRAGNPRLPLRWAGRSRAALAASVALLLFGCLWLAAGLRHDGTTGSPLAPSKNSEASNRLKLPATPDALKNAR
jgi:hypothetical protein